MVEAQIRVAGVTFEGRQDLLNGLATTGAAHIGNLQAEPENKYDSQATAVYCEGLHIGYLPRDWRDVYPANVVDDIQAQIDDPGATVEVALLLPPADRVSGTIGARVIVQIAD